MGMTTSRKRIKVLALLLPLAALAFPSCNKDKTPSVPFNPYMNDTISYSAFVKPMVTANCIDCHNSSLPQGGYDFGSYENTSAAAEVMYSSMRDPNPNTWMPEGAPERLPDSVTLRFQAWILQGKHNN
jgi:hypothetical protein